MLLSACHIYIPARMRLPMFAEDEHSIFRQWRIPGHGITPGNGGKQLISIGITQSTEAPAGEAPSTSQNHHPLQNTSEPHAQ